MFVITTDGMESTGHNYSFIGANIDAVKTNAHFGISTAAQSTTGRMHKVYRRCMIQRLIRYVQCGLIGQSVAREVKE